ncbi:NACHT domain-containing protein [Madurella fahalii]|uniref:NACHT domain-containing protein n=1 Tax=Madurella fahalii TaxID=1157608 RepID=A0ABQ0FXA1_9PEZI
MGKAKQGGEFERTGALDNPPNALLTALAKLRTENELTGSKVAVYLNEFKDKYPKAAEKYLPDSLEDILFKASYDHVTAAKPDRNAKGNDGDDEEEDEEGEEEDKKNSCRFCDPTKVVNRKPRDRRVHYGLIASGNQVIKDAKSRDKLDKDLGGNVLCIEMEAAGIVNSFPCLVIRGICDYSDSHKNRAWQEHAAAVAAAFAKELLGIVQPSEIQGDRLIKDALNEAKEVKQNIERVRKAVQDGFMDAKNDLGNLLGETELQKKKEILSWLAEGDYTTQQHDYISRLEPGADKWLLRSPGLRAWLDTPKRTLFCPGIPGAGKTIQTSILIDHLIETFHNDPTVIVAYLYCNFQRQQVQMAEHLLANLLKQLAKHHNSMPSCLKSLYHELTKKNKRPSLEDLSETFHRTKFLDRLLDIQSKIGLNLFATSRHIRNIEQRFEGIPSVVIRPSRPDVFNFLSNHMFQLPDFVRGDKSLQEEIKAEIESAIEGIFLLAQLYLDSLVGKSPKSVENFAKSLYSITGWIQCA